MARKAAPKGAKNSKNKRKVSGARGSASRQKTERVDPRGVAGIVILCIGLLTLISQFIPSSGGLLNQLMMIARGTGGMLCLLLPIMLCWAGVTLVFFSSGRMKLKTMICGALVFLFVETLLQLFEVGAIQSAIFADGAADTYGGFLIRSYKESVRNCDGGGLIGALLAWPLYKALDVWGAVIVLLFASVIVLMVFTGVSFTGVGMYLSEIIDDLRVSLAERQEEKNALRQSREEEALRIEAELAQERRMKRVAQEKAREEVQEKQEKKAVRSKREAKPEQTQEETEPVQDAAFEEEAQSEPVRKRKSKPKLEVVRPQEKEQDEPPIQTSAPKRTPAPRKRSAVREEATLYIEREDAFERDGIDVRRDAQRRSSFTIEEAENAFLYGMHSEQAGAYSPVLNAEREREEKDGAGYEVRQSSFDGYAADVQEHDDAEDEPAETWDESGYHQEEETPFWKQNPDTVIETYEETREEACKEETAEEYKRIDGVLQEHESVYAETEYREGLRRVHTPLSEAAEEDDGETPLQRSILAAQRAAQGNAPKVQNVLASQEAAVKDQPIVQLRGSRVDGTPLVMPKKDTHEAPKVLNDEYVYPPIDLLSESSSMHDPNLKAKIESNSQKLLATLNNFGVQAELTHVTHGPAITRYELKPAPGVKVSRIVNLVDDIALNMASDGVRIEAPIPGKPAVGIEIPNEKIETVSLRDVLESREMTKEKSPTAVALGKGISGAPVIADMAKMPHVLIAGATGSGKSVCINTIINSIIYRASPREVRLILIDPKVVELSVYNGIPHLLVPVVTDPKKASAALSWAVVEMEHRYKRFETMGVRNIQGYNNAIGPDEEPMSKIIVIIDELADLMMVAPGEVEESICRLAQLARAAGIHLVIATQRPSVNVITGVIKANIPSRIAFAVSSQIDSRTILDAAGAEKLLGRGDMLYALQGAGKPTRVQGCFVSDDEVQRVVDFVRGKHEADYNEDVMEQMNSAAEEEKAAAGETASGAEPVDEMLAKAIELAIDAGQVSISMLQRRLRVGYARAGRLVDEMTLRGIAGEAEGPTKPRTVLISREEWRRMQENQE